jgi:hypothetical protein
MWRNVIEGELILIFSLISLVSVLITVWLGKWFIIWGGSLINGINYI